MPPYSKDKPRPQPKPTGLVVSVPLCSWCKTAVGFPCKTCGITTCYNCLMSTGTDETQGQCVHRIYKPVVSDGWGQDCPNPMCDTECNVCMGTGTV